MTEHGGGCAVRGPKSAGDGQYRSHPAPLDAWGDVANGVDAAVQRVQATSPAPFQDGVGTQAGIPELADRYRSVLSSCELGHLTIWGTFIGHIPTKAPGRVD